MLIAQMHPPAVVAPAPAQPVTISSIMMKLPWKLLACGALAAAASLHAGKLVEVVHAHAWPASREPSTAAVAEGPRAETTLAAVAMASTLESTLARYTCSILNDQNVAHTFTGPLLNSDTFPESVFSGTILYKCNETSGGVTYIQYLTFGGGIGPRRMAPSSATRSCSPQVRVQLHHPTLHAGLIPWRHISNQSPWRCACRLRRACMTLCVCVCV